MHRVSGSVFRLVQQLHRRRLHTIWLHGNLLRLFDEPRASVIHKVHAYDLHVQPLTYL